MLSSSERALHIVNIQEATEDGRMDERMDVSSKAMRACGGEHTVPPKPVKGMMCMLRMWHVPQREGNLSAPLRFFKVCRQVNLGHP